MLDYVLPVEWRESKNGDLLGRPTAPLPAGFELLSKASENAIARSHWMEDTVLLRLPWVFGQAGVIVFHAPVRYDFSAAVFRTNRSEVEAVRARIEAACKGELIPLAKQQAGCFGQLSTLPMTPMFAAEAGPKFAEMSRDPDGGVWISELDATHSI